MKMMIPTGTMNFVRKLDFMRYQDMFISFWHSRRKTDESYAQDKDQYQKTFEHPQSFTQALTDFQKLVKAQRFA
ncbi:hypothetical protein U27_03699 [Candidatus Vecturithrix granuli]|uniref:Uncharacterized protein n=1 Tax=Vecturithrix granuli TaxID=1499967 RepID=A0A081BWN0_VECG1|nr:hypothetical protein U27_03699 [Candidatus Vecturithrix granuli]